MNFSVWCMYVEYERGVGSVPCAKESKTKEGVSSDLQSAFKYLYTSQRGQGTIERQEMETDTRQSNRNTPRALRGDGDWQDQRRQSVWVLGVESRMMRTDV